VINDYYGLYLNNSFAYHIEDNSFIGPNTFHGGIGVYINHSGQSWNQLYNNRFSWLNFGTIAYGLNRSLFNNLGLCIECNDFDYNKNDIVINGLMGAFHGIAYDQGHQGDNDTLPAGNTFTNDYSGLVYNYKNSKGMAPIKYIYHGDYPIGVKVDPNPFYSPLYVLKESNDLTQYDKDNSCPSKLNESGGGGGHDRVELQNSGEQVKQREIQLAALVDGGNTYAMNLEVVTSSPPEAGELYNELINESPFLSDTVLKSAIYKENVLPNAMVRDVLVANPHSAKSLEIMEAVDERFEPMPVWMKDQVMQGVSITGAKEALESEISKWQKKHVEIFNNLYQYFRKDTINSEASSDSLEILLAGDNRLESKYRLAFIKMKGGESLEVQAILNAIPSTFDLSQYQQNVHQDYISLFTLIIQLNGNLPVAGSTEALALESLADDEENYPGACARNILLAAGLIEYEEPIILPEDELKSSEAVDLHYKKDLSKPEILKVFPNPASNYIIVEYNTEGLNGDVSISFNDITGKSVFISNYSNKCDQVVLNTQNILSGVYYICLLVNKKVVRSEKITIK
jgi:hypothetical protein